MNILSSSFDLIGLYAPIILFLSSIYLLYPTLPYLYAFIFCSVLNSFINNGLKQWIREPRPKNPISYYDDIHIVGSQIYGMPSGHAQSVYFSTVFVFLVTKSIPVLLIFVFVSFLSIYQRWKYRRHSENQLLAGSLVGAFIAYTSFYITKHYLEKYKQSNHIL